MTEKRNSSLVSRLIAVTVLATLSGALVGCGSFNVPSIDPSDLFDFLDTKKKLPGDRRAVFPEGVPGLEQGVPRDLYKGARASAPAEVAPEPPPVIEQPKRKSAARPKREPVQQAAPDDGADAAAEEGVAAAPPAPPPPRRRTTQRQQPVQQQQSAPPEQDAAPAPFPAPLPSGSFSR